MNLSALEGSPAEIVRALRQRLRGVQQISSEARDELITSGSAALDRLLPGGGFAPGQLVELLTARPGSGAGTLAMIVARQACRSGGALVVMDLGGRFYPPAAAAWGIDLKQLIVIRGRNQKDELWALDQVLRCPGVAAAWAPLARLDQRSFRRLQLATESGRGLGLLLRPANARHQPSWSDLQLLVQPQPSRSPRGETSAGGPGRRLLVELVRCRGGTGRGAVEVEIDEVTGTIRQADAAGEPKALRHETHALSLASQLAHPTPARRSARA